MKIHRYTDYRSLLRQVALLRKESSGSIKSLSKLAEACGVQKTYLSAVLGRRAHFNRDQLFSAARFLDFPSDDFQFVEKLYEWERSTLEDRKKNIAKELEQIRDQNLKTEANIRADVKKGLKENPPETELIYKYFSNPFAPLIHMALTISQFQKNHKSLENLFGISSEFLQFNLELLSSLNLLLKNRGELIAKEIHWHLPEESTLHYQFQTTLRLRALEQIQKKSFAGAQAQNYSFGVYFSADETTRKKIREKIADLLADIQKDVAKAPAKKLLQLNIDLMEWV